MKDNINDVATHAFLFVAIDLTGETVPFPLHLQWATNGMSSDTII